MCIEIFFFFHFEGLLSEKFGHDMVVHEKRRGRYAFPPGATRQFAEKSGPG